MTKEIIIGISAGLITCVLAALFAKLWKDWLAQILVKAEFDLTGDWQTEFTEENNQRKNENVTLKQFGNKISGEIKFNGTTYKLKGSFKNHILTAEYKDADKKRIDQGSFTLLLKGRGDLLEGYYAWFNNEGEIEGGKYIWKKKKS